MAKITFDSTPEVTQNPINTGICGPSEEDRTNELTEKIIRQELLKEQTDSNEGEQGLREISEIQITFQEVSVGQEVSLERKNRLLIGDLIFSVPVNQTTGNIVPASILIDKQFINHKYQTLRTEKAFKSSSGHSTAHISMTLLFVGQTAINTGLRRLLATFKGMAFFSIENDFIRSNLIPNNEDQVMACSLQDYVIRTVEGLPTTLAMDVRLLWFNYFPYSPNFWYRRDWQVAIPQLREAGDAYGGNNKKIGQKSENIDLALLSIGEDVPSTDSLYKAIIPSTIDQSDAFMLVAQPTPFANDSILVTNRITEAEGEFKAINFVENVMDDQIVLKYQVFQKIEALDPNNVPPEIPEPLGTVMVDTDYITIGQSEFPIDMRMKKNAADALEELAHEFYTATGRRIVVNSCFRSRLAQIEIRKRKGKEIAAENSWHEVGLAVDINVADLSESNWNTLIRIADSKGYSNLGKKFGFSPMWSFNGRPLSPVQASIDKFKNPSAISLIERALKNNKKIASNWETWHFDFEGTSVRDGQNVYKNQNGGTAGAIRALRQDQYRISPKGRSGEEEANPSLAQGRREDTQKQLDAHDNYIQGLMNKIEALEKDGYVLDLRTSTSACLFFSKGKKFTIGLRNPNLIPQNISIGKSNIIASIPIVGHEYTTQQFLGSSDMDASIAFIAIGTAELRTLQNVLTEIQYNSREFRKVRNRSVLEIENNFFNLCGFQFGLVESIRTETIEGMPDTYMIRVNLTQYPAPKEEQQEKLLNQSRLIPRYLWQTVAHMVWDRILSESDIIGSLYAIEQQLFNLVPVEAVFVPDETTSITGIKKRKQRKGFEMPFSGIVFQNEGAELGFFASDIVMDKSKRSFDPETLWKSGEVQYLMGNNVFSQFLKSQYIMNSTPQHGGEFDAGTAIGNLLIKYGIILTRLLSVGGSSLHPVCLDMLGITKERYPRLYQRIEENREKVIGLGYKTKSGLEMEEKVFTSSIIKQLEALSTEALALSIYTDDPLMRLIKSAAGDSIEKKWKGLPCYPDLHLPEHPALKTVYATPPDYWFYNWDVDGQIQRLDIINKGDFFNRCKKVVDSYLEISDQGKYDVQATRNVMNINASFESSAISEDIKKKNVLGASLFPEDMLPLTTGRSYGLNEIENLKKMTNRQKVADTTIKQKMFHQNVNQFDNLDRVSFGQTDGDKSTDLDEIYKPSANNPDAMKGQLDAAMANFTQYIYRLARAFPTFKITFIEADEQINPKNFDDFYSYSAIQDIRIVKSHKNPADLCVITLVNVHAELEDITFSGGQSKDFGGKSTSLEIVEKYDPSTINTNRENPFSKLAIVEGSRIQVRLGYSNDPDELSTEFNGVVVEVGTSPSSPDIVQLVCQSFGAELVAEEKNEGEFATTQELLSSMICSPEVLNFGRWSKNMSYSPYEIRNSRSGGVNTSSVIKKLINEGKDTILNTYNFMNYPQDDNVFAPDLKAYTQRSESILDIGRSLFIVNLTDFLTLTQDDRLFKPYKSTIWDIFKEMELRHPGFVALPLNYGNRATMFFGPPFMSYWSRPANPLEQAANKRMNDLVNKLNPQRTSSTPWWVIAGLVAGAVAGVAFLPGLVLGSGLIALGGGVASLVGSLGSGAIVSAAYGVGTAAIVGGIAGTVGYGTAVAAGAGAGYAWNQYQTQKPPTDEQANMQKELIELIKYSQKGSFARLKPFRNYHILSSDHNIIANNVRVSSHGVYNAIQLTYMESDPSVQGASNQDSATAAIAGQASVLEMKADDNILDKDIRVMQDVYPTCIGPYFARRYAVSLLMRSLRDMYKGEVVVTGLPGIKPYDVVFFYDRYRDLYGPAEVEQIVQIFSKETGWITEITPDLIVAHNNFTTMGTMEAMWEASGEIYNALGACGSVGTTVAGAVGSTAVGIAGASAAGAVVGTAGAAAGVSAGVVGAAVLGTQIVVGGVGLGLAAYGAYKFIQWTQCRQPVIITPLIQGSKPLMAGLNGYKRDGLIVNLRGKFYEFSEDVDSGWNYVWNTGQVGKWFGQKIANITGK